MELSLMADGAMVRSCKFHHHDALTEVLYKYIDFSRYDMVVEKTTGEDAFTNVYVHLHERQRRNEALQEAIVWWTRYQIEHNGRIHRGSDDFVALQIPLSYLTQATINKILSEG